MSRSKSVTSRENGLHGGRPSALREGKSLSAQSLFYKGFAIHNIARHSGLPISTLYRYAKVWTQSELTVGVSSDSPLANQELPIASKNCQSELHMIHALCTTLQARPKFVRLPFADLVGAIERHDVDIGVSGLSPTDERKRKIHFTNYYTRVNDPIHFYALKSSRIFSLDQIFKGKFGTLKGSLHEVFLRNLGLKAKLFTSDVQVEAALRAKTIDAILSTEGSLSPQLLKDASIVETSFPLTYGLRSAIAVAPRFQKGEVIATTIDKMNSLGITDVIDDLRFDHAHGRDKLENTYTDLLTALRR